MSAERRLKPRRRTLVNGTLRYAAQSSTMSCVVRNLTAHGARLELDETHWLPDQFDLDVPHQNLRTPARVIWREKSALGVAFAQPVSVFHDDFVAAAPNQTETRRDERERLIFLEQERARLQHRLRELTGEL